jgi:hypothetical protein
MQVADRHFALGAIGATFGPAVQQAAASDSALQAMLVQYTPQGAKLQLSSQARAFMSGVGGAVLGEYSSPSMGRRIILNGLSMASVSLGALGVSDCDPTVQSCPGSVAPTGGKAGLTKRAKEADAELSGALKNTVIPKVKSGSSQSAQQSMWSSVLTNVVSTALGVDGKTAGGNLGATVSAAAVNVAAANPISAAVSAVMAPIGNACAELLKEAVRSIIDTAKCTGNGRDYCNPQDATRAVAQLFAESFGRSVNKFSMDYGVGPQSYDGPENMRWKYACDNDRRGQISYKCLDRPAFDITASDDSINEAPFAANESVIRARINDANNDLAIRQRLGLLNLAEQKAVDAFAQLQVQLAWLALQKDPNNIDEFVIQNDPSYSIFSDEQKTYLYKKFAAKKRELGGVIASASNNLPLILGIGALGLGGYFVWKKTRG